jgi:predicted MFS family arabinose efflux permease
VRVTSAAASVQAAAGARRAAGRARIALVVVFAVNGAVLATFAARIPAVQQLSGLSAAQLGAVLLAPAAGALCAFELAGRVAARWGSGATTAVCAVVFPLLLPLVALAAADPAVLGVALFAFGAGNGALDVSMNAAGIRVERALGRPVLSGMHAAYSAGALAGSAAGGAAAAAGLGLRTHALLAAGVALACALAATRWLPRGAADRAPDPSSGPADLGAAPRVRRRVLPTPVLLLGVVGFAALLAEGAAGDWSALYLRTEAGAGPGTAAAAYAAFSAAMLVGRVLGDRLRARVPAVRLLAGSAGVAALGLAAGLAVGGVAAGVVGFAVLGAGLAVIVPVVFAAGGTLPPERTGMPAARALGRVNTLSYLGLLAGPPIVGAVAGAVGLRAALVVPVVLAAAIAVLAGPAVGAGRRGAGARRPSA